MQSYPSVRRLPWLAPRAVPVLVPTVRLELTRLTPLPPQDSVSTNSTTSARARSLRYVNGLGFVIGCRRGGYRRRGALRDVGCLAVLVDGCRRARCRTLLHNVHRPGANGTEISEAKAREEERGGQ